MKLVKKFRNILLLMTLLLTPWLATIGAACYRKQTQLLPLIGLWLIYLTATWIGLQILGRLSKRQLEYWLRIEQDDQQPIDENEQSNESRVLTAATNHPWFTQCVFLLGCVGAVILEELAYRAPLLVLFPLISQAAVQWMVALGLLFGLLHYPNSDLSLVPILIEEGVTVSQKQRWLMRAGYMILMTIGGIAQGWVTVHYQSIWPAVLFHFLFNYPWAKLFVIHAFSLLLQLVVLILSYGFDAPFRYLQRFTRRTRRTSSR